MAWSFRVTGDISCILHGSWGVTYCENTTYVSGLKLHEGSVQTQRESANSCSKNCWRAVSSFDTLTFEMFCSLAKANRIFIFDIFLIRNAFKVKQFKYQRGICHRAPPYFTQATSWQQILSQSAVTMTSTPPAIYQQYMDDTSTKLYCSSIYIFIQNMNNINLHIKFRCKTEKDSKLPFLDTWRLMGAWRKLVQEVDDNNPNKGPWQALPTQQRPPGATTGGTPFREWAVRTSSQTLTECIPDQNLWSIST